MSASARTASSSGANNVPLGSRNSSTSAPVVSSLLKPSYLAETSGEPIVVVNEMTTEETELANRVAAQGLEAARAAAAAAAAKVERRRKRKSRWAEETSDKTFIPGMPTMLPLGLSKDQEEAYLLQLKIEDTSRRLRRGDLGIPLNPEDRSPSPEPIYSSDGKRLNTRDYRKRKELEEIRHDAISRMMDINMTYKPPPDYKAPAVKVNDKVMIPQDIHPDINFVGLLIGPRGNTLKSMERDTGAKIIIRGKGSVKEGKVGRKDGQPLPGEDEPLHAYVTGNNPEDVLKAVNKIKEIIRQGVDVPEEHNDLRKNQLRELALLNGTLREGDGLRCSNCGALDHKTWACGDKLNITNSVICVTCGGVGHLSKDCTVKKMGVSFDPAHNKMDDEYMSLMAELGEGVPTDKPYQEGRIQWGQTKIPYQQTRIPKPVVSTPRPPPLPPLPPNPETPTPASTYGYGGGEAWPPSKPPSLMNSPPWPPRWNGGAPRPPSHWSENYNFLAAPPPPPPPPVPVSADSSWNMWSGPPPPTGPVPPPAEPRFWGGKPPTWGPPPVMAKLMAPPPPPPPS